ncbi:MAG: GNAT family N-acetyltransferase [Desulfatitalea sp.]
MEIIEARAFNPELLAAVNALLPQLSDAARPIGEAEMAAVLCTQGTILFVAVEAEKYFGMLTLVTFAALTGKRARIEDLVVDAQARGKGVGRRLVAHAIQAAERSGARGVDLTSNPSRLAANRLYQAMGFELQSTNVYRWTQRQ